MALSNAERQARFRARMREQASLDRLAEQAVDRAIEALWAFRYRASPDGRTQTVVDGLGTVEAFRTSLEIQPTKLVDTCRQVQDEPGLTDDERAALVVVIRAYDALTLAGTVPDESSAG